MNCNYELQLTTLAFQFELCVIGLKTKIIYLRICYIELEAFFFLLTALGELDQQGKG